MKHGRKKSRRHKKVVVVVAVIAIVTVAVLGTAEGILIPRWAERMVTRDIREGRLELAEDLQPRGVSCTSLLWTGACCAVHVSEDRAYEVHVWPLAGETRVLTR